MSFFNDRIIVVDAREEMETKLKLEIVFIDDKIIVNTVDPHYPSISSLIIRHQRNFTKPQYSFPRKCRPC
jgi:hypothetical protein